VGNACVPCFSKLVGGSGVVGGGNVIFVRWRGKSEWMLLTVAVTYWYKIMYWREFGFILTGWIVISMPVRAKRVAY
jgi:hypothetical protein